MSIVKLYFHRQQPLRILPLLKDKHIVGVVYFMCILLYGNVQATYYRAKFLDSVAYDVQYRDVWCCILYATHYTYICDV